MRTRYAYLHGFASSAQSKKGQEVRRRFAALAQERGDPTLELHTPDLNYPSFAELTYSGMLEAFDMFDRELDASEGVEPGSTRWCLIGSSMGGWVASRWAELHPDRVQRLLLLCPAFDFVTRWPALLGAQQFERWRERGSIPLPDGAGKLVDVHFQLYTDALTQPSRPEVPCPTRIIHGTGDTMVPIASSREYAASHEPVELIEVDDDHHLMRSIHHIEQVVREFLLVQQPAVEQTLWWEFFGPPAQGTAAHFHKHLDEFLAREQIAGCTTGVEVFDPGRHAAAWCRAPVEHVELLVRVLKPRRVI